MLEPTETRTRRHLWLTLLAVLALVAALTFTLLAGRGQVTGPNTLSLVDGTLTISTFKSADLVCPSDPAFSPDGSRLAVFGVLASSLTTNASCTMFAGGTTSAAYAVSIFDTTSGQPIRSMSLDPQMLDTASTHAGAYAGIGPLQFAYSALGWSPDSTHFALAFTAFGAGAHTPENVLDSGLLLLNTNSGRMTVERGDSGFFAAVSGVSSGFPVWHLAQDSELPSYVPPAGLAYSWSDDGLPQPLLPLTGALSQLPPEAGPRYPVGMPDGGSRFTIWQPGLVVGASSMGGAAAQGSFVTAFPAWSPDGAHVTLMVAGVALARNTSTGPAHAASGPKLIPPLPLPATLPLVPPRDAALATVQSQVGDSGWAAVAWNADGSLLASTDCFATHDRELAIRETASGAVLERQAFALPDGDVGCAAGQQSNTMGGYPGLALSLQWSPLGDRLLLSDCSSGTLTLYSIRHRAGGNGGPS